MEDPINRFKSPESLLVKIICGDGAVLYFDKYQLLSHSTVLSNMNACSELNAKDPGVEIQFDSHHIAVYLYMLSTNDFPPPGMVKSYRILYEIIDFLDDFKSHVVDCIWTSEGGIVEFDTYKKWFEDRHGTLAKVREELFYKSILDYLTENNI